MDTNWGTGGTSTPSFFIYRKSFGFTSTVNFIMQGFGIPKRSSGSTAPCRIERVVDGAALIRRNTRDGVRPDISPAVSSEWVFNDEHLGFTLGAIDIPSNLELRVTEGAGVGLFARKDIKKGEQIILELPLLRIEWSTIPVGATRSCQEVSSKVSSKVSDKALRHLVTEATFVPAVAWARGSAELRAELLALHVPIVPRELREAVKSGVEMLSRAGWLKSIDIEGATNFCFTSLSTSFDMSDQHYYSGEFLVHGTGSGLVMGLFRLTSRINHSCLPNCWWHVENGEIMSVSALVDISAGEEISHSYFEEERWKCKGKRQEALQSKFFVCTCSRCSSEEAEPEADQEVRALVQHCHQNWAELDEATIFLLVEAFKLLLSPNQHACTSEGLSKTRLRADFHDLLSDLHKISGLWHGAAEHIEEHIKCLRQIYPRPSNRTAWLMESLGDMQACAAGMPPSLVIEPEFLDAMERMAAKPLRLPVPATFQEGGGNGAQHSAMTLKGALETYVGARNELVNVYGGAARSRADALMITADIEGKMQALSSFMDSTLR